MRQRSWYINLHSSLDYLFCPNFMGFSYYLVKCNLNNWTITLLWRDTKLESRALILGALSMRPIGVIYLLFAYLSNLYNLNQSTNFCCNTISDIDIDKGLSIFYIYIYFTWMVNSAGTPNSTCKTNGACGGPSFSHPFYPPPPPPLPLNPSQDIWVLWLI